MKRSINTEHRRLSWVLGLFLLLFAAPAYSQSLGDIARQERERKASQPQAATHVYTNDDLAKPKILLPEDQKRIEAVEVKGSVVTPVPSAPVPEAASNVSNPTDPNNQGSTDGLPLGDVARHYRAVKEARGKSESPSAPPQFRLNMPTLAHPALSLPVVNATAPPAPARIVKTNPEPAGKTTSIYAAGSTRVRYPYAAGSARARYPEDSAEGTRIRVQPGDTLWALARQYLGRGKSWTLLSAINLQVSDPTRLRVGTSIRLPDRSSATDPLGPGEYSPRKVRVERGDTLWKLTRTYFGDGADWRCLARANPQIINADLIVTGQTLTMPADCAAMPSPRVSNATVSFRPLAGSPETP